MIVTVLCDGATKYLSEPFWDDQDSMIKIDNEAWDVMVAHAESKFPNECCGAMIGRIDDEREARHRGRSAGERLRGRAGRAL